MLARMRRALAVALVLTGCGTASPPVETTSAQTTPAQATFAPTNTEPSAAPARVSEDVCSPRSGTRQDPPRLSATPQPTVFRMMDWDGGVVVVTPAGKFMLDVAAGTATPFVFDELDRVTDLAEWQRRPIAWGSRGEQRTLLVARGDAWESLPVPPGFTDGNLVTDGSTLALVGASDVALSEDGATWRTVTGAVIDRPNTMVLHGGRLYMGFDRGEFGGGLEVVDLRTSPPTRTGGLSQTSLPVRSIEAHGPRVWVLEGLAHMGLSLGRLRRFEGGVETTVLACDGLSDEERRSCTYGCVGMVRWPYEATAFETMALDDRGRPHIVTFGSATLRIGEPRRPNDVAGLVRVEDDGSITRLTPSWRYRSEYWMRMRLHGDIAVLGGSDYGVLLWPLVGDTVRTVCLPQPAADE